MSNIVIMDAIREFVKNCPYLDEFNKGIGVDYLDAEETCYSVESVPADPILKRYIDGTTKRQQVFVFSSREAYGDDVRQNIENLGFFEHFASWLEKQTLTDNLPDLGEQRTAEKITASTTGYAYNTDVKNAKYQIECRLIYLQEGE